MSGILFASLSNRPELMERVIMKPIIRDVQEERNSANVVANIAMTLIVHALCTLNIFSTVLTD